MVITDYRRESYVRRGSLSLSSIKRTIELPQKYSNSKVLEKTFVIEHLPGKEKISSKEILRNCRG